MKFLLELEKGDHIEHFEPEVGLQVALRALAEALGVETATSMQENLDSVTLRNIGDTFLQKYIERNGSMFIELDGGGQLTITGEKPDPEPEKVEAPEPVESNNIIATYLIPSSDKSTEYAIEIATNGNAVSCTCPARLYRPNDPCKHMDKAEMYWAEDHEQREG